MGDVLRFFTNNKDNKFIFLCTEFAFTLYCKHNQNGDMVWFVILRLVASQKQPIQINFLWKKTLCINKIPIKYV